MIPWAIISQAASGIIGLIVRNRAERARLKKEMFDYIQRYDENLLRNALVRREYEELRKQALKRDKAIITGRSSVE